MSLPEVMEHLCQLGVRNITDKLDLASITDFPIASGGFGDVYQGRLNNDAKIAIKTMRFFANSEEINQKRRNYAAREIYVWSKCQHPNVQQLLGLVHFRNQLGMVSFWEANGNMSEYIDKYPGVDRLELCSQIVEGLSYLHSSGIIHGDLKGSNVLISETGHALLTDFGNATRQENTLQFTGAVSTIGRSSRWTVSGECIFNAKEEEAPELFEESVFTPESDVYALGMTILEAITGAYPWPDLPTERAVMFAVCSKKATPERPVGLSKSAFHDALWSTLESCWNYEPVRRPSVLEVQKVLQDKERQGGPPATLGFLASNDFRRVSRHYVQFTQPLEKVISALCMHGCPDLTAVIDIRASSIYPTDIMSGDEDIYRSRLIDNTEVAVKVLRVQLDKYGTHSKRIARELYLLSIRNHPNIQRFLGVTRFLGRIGMVSQWPHYWGIQQYLKEHPNEDRCALAVQVVEGLSYLHGLGVLHGDMRASNIIVSQDGVPQITSVYDTSFLKLEFTSDSLRDTVSSRWAAPELFEGKPLSLATDIYALGMTILEIITNEIPWPGLSERAVLFQVTVKNGCPDRPVHIPTNSTSGDTLWSLLDSCWRYEPEERPDVNHVKLVMSGITADGLMPLLATGDQLEEMDWE
ncbi:Tyrosine kinase catalytic domain protein [Ceratobasidium sp. AG-Ba]|nr:Tyrosine kinase catalytic domain protein [Ceratobasidium sp. AG-Ba]